MGHMKDLLITVYGGGDEAVAAVDGMSKDWREQLEQAASEIERRWIPVEERLPPDNVAVLVNHESSGVEMAFRQDGQWGISWTNHMHSGCAYTHWMPLPEPPA
jgi:hypothetical protein